MPFVVTLRSDHDCASRRDDGATRRRHDDVRRIRTTGHVISGFPVGSDAGHLVVSWPALTGVTVGPIATRPTRPRRVAIRSTVTPVTARSAALPTGRSFEEGLTSFYVVS